MSNTGKGLILKILIICTFIMLFVGMVRVLLNKPPLLFEELLDYLQSINTDNFITDIISKIDMGIQGDWGWFDFFRQFLNLFTPVANFIVTFVGIIYQLLKYVIGIIKFVFIL